MNKSLTVWVVDDDASIRWVLERALTGAGIEVRSFPGGAELLDALAETAVEAPGGDAPGPSAASPPGAPPRGSPPDVLVTDIRMPGISGLDLLDRVCKAHPELPIIIMTAHSDLESAVAAYRGGAFEYLPKPFDLDEALDLIRRAADTRGGGARGGGGESDTAIIGEAPAMQEVFRAIGRLSASHITVMITGESGTGKELVARALHEHSPRADKDFIAVNTAAIPRDLMESEFFGHEKGAFTGAHSRRLGRFEQADGGTLFLDEIGDMPAELQTRLLRVLSDGQFYRVGGTTPLTVDVRIIAATNQDLETAVARGEFREDLYHRLNVIRLRVPPLRERREDIPPLLRHFLARAARELRMDVKRLHLDVEKRLAARDWPGNVRQLENLCRWLTVMAPGAEILIDDLPAELRGRDPAAGGDAEVPAGGSSAGDPTLDWDRQLERWAERALAGGDEALLKEALPRFERTLILAALDHTGGRRQEAARLLGWGRNTLTRKIKDLSLDV